MTSLTGGDWIVVTTHAPIPFKDEKSPDFHTSSSDQAKSVTTYIAKHKELVIASQNECATLKNRIAELTAQLEAKSKPDINTVTAIEKAELMEAELQDLHERLDKYEEDLNAAQSELATAKARNAELENEIEQQQAKANSDHAMMAKAHSHITSLHNEYKKMRDELLLAQKALKAKDAALSPYADAPQTSVDVSISEKARGKRPEVGAPSAADWEETATLLASLQKDVARLKQERAALDKELSELRRKLKSKEEENEVLGDKLHASADLAAELSRLHVAANTRASDAENKLLTAEHELRRTKELIAVREKEKEDLQIAVRVTEFARQADFASRISALEKEIADLTEARDAALAQIDVWEQNRGMWKRWGETMALRAKQWEEEAQKARKPRGSETSLTSKVRLEEPPPLTPISTATTLLTPVSGGEPGHTRKRPHDMPDTDVDGHCDIVQSSGDETVQGRVERAEQGETSGRKKARFSEGLKRGT
ncbi:hypothetical protein FRC06_009432 [Ceratobasidium sp. 370]|nr:hypothetical protein FRC06_009432 [Ceratobasidium sp. 370]